MSPFSVIVGAWIVFVVFWAVTAFNVKRDVPGFWWRSARVRLIVGIIAFLFIEITGRGAHLWFMRLSISSGPLATAGAVLVVLGVAFAIWARIHLGRNWSPAPALKEGHELVTSGPYALVRHPIYTGMLLALLGNALASPVWIVLFAAALGVFLWRVKREEALMTEQFPAQYPDYRKRTWALVPYVY